MLKYQRIELYSALLLLLTFVPFLTLPFFSYPAWDDYMLFPYVKANGVFDTVKLYYLQFNGRFSSMTILSVFYLIAAKFGLNGWLYQLTLFLNLLFFAFSLYFLFKRIFKDLSEPNVATLTFSFVLMFNSVAVNVSQYYYWIPSSLFYLLGTSFMCVFFGIFFFQLPNLRIKLLLFLLAILICGSMETNIIVFNLIFLGAFAIKLSNGTKIEKWVYLLGAWILLLSLAELLAPGGRNRSEQYIAIHAQDPSFALKATANFTWRMFLSILLHPSVWIFSLYYYLITSKRQSFFSTKIFQKPYPILISISLFLPFLLIVFLVFFGLGGRLIEYRIMSALTFLVLIILVGQLELIRPLIAHLFIKVEKNKLLLTFIPLFLVLAAFVRPSAFSVAISDLTSGKASQYKSDQLRRFQLLKNGPDEMSLPGLTAKPASLFTLDIHKDPNFFFNPQYAKTYGKKSVWIENDNKATEFESYLFKADSTGSLVSKDMN